MQFDGVNSNGGAFTFTTSGKVTFTQDIETNGDIYLLDTKSIGIGPTLERLEFYTAGRASFEGCWVTATGGIHVGGTSDPGTGIAHITGSIDGVYTPLILENTEGYTFTFYALGASHAISNALTIYDGTVHRFCLREGSTGFDETNPAGKVHITQSNNNWAKPALIIGQGDISEGFINFVGSDRGVIAGATNSLKSVRVEFGGVVYRLALYVDA